MSKKKYDRREYSYDREDEREMKKIHRVETPKKWKFDKTHVEKYFREDYEDEYEGNWGK
jgi:hypothetical protein